MTNTLRILPVALLLALTAACGGDKAASRQEGAPQVAFHSHNDYAQQEPFQGAFRAGAASIEADVFLVDSTIMLGHDSPTDQTISQVYLDPIREAFRQNGGSVYPGGKGLQLLVDLKDGAPALVALQQLIEAEYKECFDARHNEGAARLVVTGDKIKPEEFAQYADFVYFDARPGQELTAGQLDRVALVSDYFGRYTSANEQNPKGPSTGLMRVVRGGSYADSPAMMLNTQRYHMKPKQASPKVGFRLAHDI